MIAFMDESVHVEAELYVVGCVIVPHSECDELRNSFDAKVRFHFHSEGEEQRMAMLRKIAGCDVASAAYFRRSLQGGEPRARKLCLNSLLWDLNQNGVGELVIESRKDPNDRIDRLTIRNAQDAKIASPDLRYGWNSPKGDPMLWTADAVASGVAGHLRHGRYVEELQALRTVIRPVA